MRPIPLTSAIPTNKDILLPFLVNEKTRPYAHQGQFFEIKADKKMPTGRIGVLIDVDQQTQRFVLMLPTGQELRVLPEQLHRLQMTKLYPY